MSQTCPCSLLIINMIPCHFLLGKAQTSIATLLQQVDTLNRYVNLN